MFDLSFFLGENFSGNDGFQNKFFYHPTFNIFQLKEVRGADYVIGWKSKGVYNSKLTSLHTSFLNNIKLSVYKIGM